MNDLIVFAAHNTVFALVFALFVYALTRVWRNPPVAHVLWLLVLIKLIAPPLMHVDWSQRRLPESASVHDPITADGSAFDVQKATSQPQLVDWPIVQATFEQKDDVAANAAAAWARAQPVVLFLWLGGAVCCAMVVAVRVVRFERLLRETLPASERLQRLTCEIAGKIGIRRVPDVRYVQCADIPLVWCVGRGPIIVLPMRLIRQLDEHQITMILAHELAHLRRRDHWVRGVELIVSIVYWWNPLVWVIRRQLHQAEDLCCDAWVRWSIPDCAKTYAEVLLKTAESLSVSQVGARLMPESPFLRSLSLKARIEMILESRFSPQVSAKSMLIATLFACLVLPTFIQTTPALGDDEVNSTPSQIGDGQATDPSSTAAFPHKVEFEQGATRFKEGDEIKILEIRGTAKTFIPGNIYWIRGTYTLASHDQALLAAFTTAKDVANAKSRYLKVQTKDVDRGSGTFTLYLPMLCEGWPHVSFYDGEGFGGNYFGTGESVLKKMWGSKKSD